MNHRKPGGLAKLTQPSPAGAIPRRRLFDLIDRRRSHPVIWIAGPPGSGKTVLVTSYLAARNIPCLWYQVDQGDDDIASFFYYMGLAAKRATPRRRRSLPLLTSEYLQDIPAFTRRYFEKLYGRLLGLSPSRSGSGPPARFAVVLDNYQEVPEESDFHEVIREAISEVPAGVNVVTMSRREPPALFARMRANRHIGIVGWEELRFDFNESKRMIHRRGYRKLSVELLRQIHDRTEGWAAGLVLLTEGAKTTGFDHSISPARLPEGVFHYFAREIFDKTGRATQDFLLKTALFPRMTPSMAEALTGDPDAGRVLSDLNRKNYFTQKHAARTTFFQYHPLLRDFLQAQGKQSFGPGELSEIERQAAAILKANGQVEDAAELLSKTEHWSDLVRLILEHGPALIPQGRSQTLEDWLGNLPCSQLEAEPWLLYWLGVCRLPFSPPESSTLFGKALALFRARKEAAGVFLALSGLFDSTTFGTENFRAYDRWIDLLKRIRNEYRTFPSEEIEARLMASVAFSIIARRPARLEFEAWMGRALSLANESRDISVKTRALQSLASHYIFGGNLSKAAIIVDRFHEITRSPGVSSQHLILLKMLEAMFGWLSGSFQECLEAAVRGLDLADSAGVHFWDAFLLGHAAAGALSQGDTAAARRFLERILPTLGWIPTWAKEYYHVLQAWASLIEGNLPCALSHAESSMALAAETGMVLTETFDRLCMALILVELKRQKEARDQLDLVRTEARRLDLPLAEFTCHLVQARLAFGCREESCGLESLKGAMTLGREQGYVNTFFWHAPIMADLCLEALDAGIEVDYVRNLIQKRGLLPDRPPYECDHWPWPLRIFTLGRFELVRDGAPVEFPVRAPRKTLALLEVLVSSGSAGLSEEQLTDAIWPEADGDLAHQAFATALHRLRRLLGGERVIQLRNGHLKLDDRRSWVDAHVFEHLLEQADTHADMELLQKTVALYSGPFLGGESFESWAISYGERLRSKFLRAVATLANSFEKRGEPERAIEYYRKGLEVDGLAEEFYQRLILIYHNSGRTAEALAVYLRCREMLHSVLGVEPSAKTQHIFKTVRKRN